jgi:cytochrome c
MRTGPNLYGQMGETFGDIEDFRWSPGLQALNEAGVEITEENFTAYIQDPTGSSRSRRVTNLRGAMAAQRLRGDTDGADLYAYLVSLAAE